MRKRTALFLGIFCLSAGLVACVYTAKLPKEQRTRVYYGQEARQLMDIYTPERNNNGRVIVFFYGGGWHKFPKNSYIIAPTFTRLGYTVVIPYHALYPSYRYPVFVQDAALAVAWVQHHIGDYGASAEKLFVMGFSSGAHIGALLAADAHYLKDAGGDRDAIAGFVGLAGPYEYMPMDVPNVTDIFKQAGGIKNAMPLTYIDGKQPPMLLLHGVADDIITVKNSQNMQKKIIRDGGDVTVKLYPGVGHDILWTIVSTSANAEVVNEIDHFFNRLDTR